jgi:hypothetical protein
MRDYDKDGEISVSGDEYGSLLRRRAPGYIQKALVRTKDRRARRLTTSIRSYNDDVQVCLQNMEGWTNEILGLALRLNETTFV